MILIRVVATRAYFNVPTGTEYGRAWRFGNH